MPDMPLINFSSISLLFSTFGIALAGSWGITKALHFLKSH